VARRTLTTTAAALTAAAALLLTGCGGDDKSSDDLKGADTGSGSPSASPSTSQASGAKRPVITLPSSFQLPFENWTDSDPVKQAVLNDAKEEIRAGYAAITANNPDSEAVAFYDTKGVVPQTKAWIKTYTDKNLTIMGKLPVFASNKRGASVTYCTDESKAYTKNRKTGKEESNPAGTNPYVVYSVSLTKNAQGVWQNSSVSSKRGGCSR
jgi:hypothetical protein